MIRNGSTAGQLKARSRRVQITLSAILAPLTEAILQGEVSTRGVNLTLARARSVDDNSRRMLDLSFDVAEMSFATFLRAREDGLPLIGIPIFTGRRFLQPGLVVRKNRGIDNPACFTGKRVGLPQFWMTSSVWHRGILRSEYGVFQEQVCWYTGAPERIQNVAFPANVSVRSLLGGGTLDALITRDEIDALMLPRPHGRMAQAEFSLIHPFPDVQDEQRKYYGRTGIFPILHLVIMKEELASRYPWLPESLCEAFNAAKRKATERGRLLQPIEGDSPEETYKLFKDDPWPYGIARNRATINMFLEYAADQGLIQGKMSVESLFAVRTLDLFT